MHFRHFFIQLIVDGIHVKGYVSEWAVVNLLNYETIQAKYLKVNKCGLSWKLTVLKYWRQKTTWNCGSNAIIIRIQNSIQFFLFEFYSNQNLLIVYWSVYCHRENYCKYFMTINMHPSFRMTDWTSKIFHTAPNWQSPWWKLDHRASALMITMLFLSVMIVENQNKLLAIIINVPLVAAVINPLDTKRDQLAST